MRSDVPVSIGIPVRNGEIRVSNAIRSVLAQDFPDLELVISDNASTDGTEDVCREFARADPRIRYFRQPENIGLLNNFIAVMSLARGRLFTWVGDDDALELSYVSRCKAVLDADDELLLTTVEVRMTGPNGALPAAHYEGTAFESRDPVDRFCEMLRLLNAGLLLIDPLSAMIRRERALSISRKNMLCEDQIFACKLALAGPWAHVPEVLANCRYDGATRLVLTGRLGLPAWHARVATARELAELLRVVQRAPLDNAQRRRARAAVLRWYGVSHRLRAVNRITRVVAPSRRSWHRAHDESS